MDAWLALSGAVALIAALLSQRIRHLPLSEPLLGLALGVVAGPALLGWLDVGEHDVDTVVLEAARLLLAVALMAVALRYPTSVLRRRAGRVALAVLILMPAMAGVTALLGWWLLGIPAGLAWLLGAAACPTDPVLASTVVTGEPAEQDIPGRLREVLSLESGANDGLALPLVAIGVATATGGPLGEVLRGLPWRVGGAIAIGVAAGLAVGWLTRREHQRRDIDPSVETLMTLVLALLVLGIAGSARTDGVLGVFAAGLAYNAITSGAERRPEVQVDEAVNRILVLPVFALLGVVLPLRTWADVGWPLVGFVLAVLLLRRLPAVALLRRPLGLRRPADVGFYGWFGPIGASSLFYLAHARHEGVDDPVLWAAGTAVVAASAVVHGATATPGRIAYARAAGSREPARAS